MEYTSLITNDALLKLKCDSCKNYLSYFPIYVSDADKKNICGRCSHVLQENHVRNEIYEALAQFVKFPCRYKTEGCSENVEPNSIPNHERVCDFRVVKCPTIRFTECMWEDARPGCLNHCQDKHSELMVEDYEFQLDLSKSYECMNLLEHDSFLFIVRQQFDSVSNLMKFSICHIECEVNTNEFPYEICFKTGSRSVVVQNRTTAFNDEKVAEIYLHSLKDKDDDTSIVIGNIKFKDCAVHVLVKEVILEELLAPFVCVTCSEYALPPVFCQNNNGLWGEAPVICSDCKEGRKSRFGEINPIEGTRNFGLERIANLLNFPCKRKRNGCTFVAKLPQMQLHFQSCLYSDHYCPLSEYCDCKWKGVGKDIMTHILDKHNDMILNNESVISENIVDTEVTNSGSENLCNTTVSSSTSGSIFGTTTTTSASSASVFGAFTNTTCTNTQKNTFVPPMFITSSGGVATRTNTVSSNNIFGMFTTSISTSSTSSTFGGTTTTASGAVFPLPTNHNSASRRRVQVLKLPQPIKTNTTDAPKPNDKVSKCYVIKFSNRLFRLNFAITGENFRWTVQMIGPFEHGFMFELEVIDTNNMRNNLISRQPCVSLKKNDIFGLLGCYFFRDQIASLLSNQISFKVRIYK